MLVDKDKLKFRYQLFEIIHDVKNLDAALDQIISATGKLTRQNIVQCLRNKIYVNERTRLPSVALNCHELVKISFKDKLVDHRIEPHALAVAVNIATSYNIGLDLFIHQT